MPNSYLLLGRTGDLLSILPFLKAEPEKPNLVVSNQHIDLFDGVSYVNAVPFDGGIHMLREAFDFSKEKFPDVKSLQVIGNTNDVAELTYAPNGQNSAITTSFVKEIWKIAGKMHLWDDVLPLIFDQRNPERETALLKSCNVAGTPGRKKPLLLVSIKGNTSPFPYCDLLMELLRLKFGKEFHILEPPKAERIYDLLALYERAHCLVTVDSAPLHLARACPDLPVIALTNDRPMLWNGSAWEPNWAWCCRYHDFPERATEMLSAIETCRCEMVSPFIRVWNEYDLDQKPRHTTRKLLPVYPGACGRDSANTIKDEKRVPYFKDCLRMGLQRAVKDERVCLTRPDTGIEMSAVMDMLPKSLAAFAYRLTRNGEGDTFSPISDLFCAPKSWWKERLSEIPDLLFGNDYYWSQALWALFKKHGAVDVTGVCYRMATEPKPKSDDNAPRLVHNRELCAAYVKTSGVHSRYPKVSEQIETLPLETGKLHPHGYNPSIIDRGKILMVYRFHSGGLATKLSLAELDDSGKVESDIALEIEGKSIEDAKWFEVGGLAFLSWVESLYPETLTSVVKYSPFGHASKDSVPQQPSIVGNDGTTTQKNWVFFGFGSHICVLYQCYPTHQIFDLESKAVYETSAPRWPYGTIKGGTPPVEYEGKLLRFFHATLDNELTPNRRRYYIGAYLMEPEPPFAVVRVSRKPIIYGSEIGAVKPRECFHFKQNVCFPSGVVVRDNYWLLSLGVNDSECVIAKVNPSELNL